MTDGYVVVLFGSASEGWCDLSNCPLGTAEWFLTKDDAVVYAASVPEDFQPHILTISKDGR